MRRKRAIGCIIIFLLAVNIFFILAAGRIWNPQMSITADFTLDTAQKLQISYTTSNEATAETLVFEDFNYNGEDTFSIEINVPKNVKIMRFDFGDLPGKKVIINNVQFSVMGRLLNLTDSLTETDTFHMMSQDDKTYEYTQIDPYIVYHLNQDTMSDFWDSTLPLRLSFALGLSVIFDILIVVLGIMIYRNKNARSLLNNWRMIWSLSKRDFKTKYAGSYLGIFWAFVQPIVTILLYWFVFEVGFRSAPTNGFPFVLWLISGLVPWFMFSDGITAVTNCLFEYSYLVKKVVFNIKMLPIVKIISALYVHLFFICFTIIIFVLNGYIPNLYALQILYYLIAMLVLILALGFTISAVVVFFRDLGQIVQICLQIGVWMTPIMWNLTMVGPKLQFIFKLNPIYYLVEGYRDCFINHVWFWEKPGLTIYYWCIVLLLFVAGTKIFKRLQIHFADVL